MSSNELALVIFIVALAIEWFVVIVAAIVMLFIVIACCFDLLPASTQPNKPDKSDFYQKKKNPLDRGSF